MAAREKTLSDRATSRHDQTSPQALPRRSALGRILAYRLVTDGALLLLFAVWYLLSLRLPEYVLPSPVKVVARAFDLLVGSPALFQHTYISLGRVLASVLLALVLGSALVLVARYAWLTRGLVVDRLLPILNAFPTLGWAILGLYWFGVGDSSVIFVQVAILVPFSMINMWEGLKTLDEETMEMAYSFSRSRWKILRKVVLPLLLPYLFASLRVSYGVSWKVALIAELFGSSVGLGYLLNYSRQQFDSSMLFATILTLVILVYAVDKLIFERLEHTILKYRSQTSLTAGALS